MTGFEQVMNRDYRRINSRIFTISFLHWYKKRSDREGFSWHKKDVDTFKEMHKATMLEF